MPAQIFNPDEDQPEPEYEEQDADSAMQAGLAELAIKRAEWARNRKKLHPEPILPKHSEDEVANALVDILGLNQAPVQKAASLKVAGDSVSIADLPEKPKEMVDVGDWVEITPMEGDMISGTVDRVSNHHLSVRPDPQVVRSKVKGHSVDWRNRDNWQKFRFIRRKPTEG